MGKSNPKVILFKDIENRNPILAGRFHTNIDTVIFGKPVTQFLQTFREGREAGLFVFCTVMGIRNADAGKDPGFVDIKATAIMFENFKGQKVNLLKVNKGRTDSDWSSGKIESTLEEISLRATGMRQTLMPQQMTDNI